MRLFLLISVTMMAFAANSVINRAALADGAIGPVSFALLRLWFGVAVLAVFVGLKHRRLPRPELRWAGTFGLLAYMLGFSLAYVSLDAGLGALLLFGGVQVTMFAGALLRGQKPGVWQWIGAGVALGGLAVLLWPGGSIAIPPLAAGMMILAAIGWGIYSLAGQGAQDAVLASCSSFAVAALMTLALWLVWVAEPLTPQGIALAALSGAVTSGLFYPLWYWLLPQIRTTSAAVAQLSVPAIAAAGGIVFLGETVTVQFVTATLLVLGGIGLSVLVTR